MRPPSPSHSPLSAVKKFFSSTPFKTGSKVTIRDWNSRLFSLDSSVNFALSSPNRSKMDEIFVVLNPKSIEFPDADHVVDAQVFSNWNHAFFNLYGVVEAKSLDSLPSIRGLTHCFHVEKVEGKEEKNSYYIKTLDGRFLSVNEEGVMSLVSAAAYHEIFTIELVKDEAFLEEFEKKYNPDFNVGRREANSTNFDNNNNNFQMNNQTNIFGGIRNRINEFKIGFKEGSHINLRAWNGCFLSVNEQGNLQQSRNCGKMEEFTVIYCKEKGFTDRIFLKSWMGNYVSCENCEQMGTRVEADRNISFSLNHLNKDHFNVRTIHNTFLSAHSLGYWWHHVNCNVWEDIRIFLVGSAHYEENNGKFIEEGFNKDQNLIASHISPPINSSYYFPPTIAPIVYNAPLQNSFIPMHPPAFFHPPPPFHYPIHPPMHFSQVPPPHLPYSHMPPPPLSSSYAQQYPSRPPSQFNNSYVDHPNSNLNFNPNPLPESSQANLHQSHQPLPLHPSQYPNSHMNPPQQPNYSHPQPHPYQPQSLPIQHHYANHSNTPNTNFNSYSQYFEPSQPNHQQSYQIQSQFQPFPLPHSNYNSHPPSQTKPQQTSIPSQPLSPNNVDHSNMHNSNLNQPPITQPQLQPPSAHSPNLQTSWVNIPSSNSHPHSPSTNNPPLDEKR